VSAILTLQTDFVGSS